MECVLVQSNGERKRWRQPCLQACRRVGGTNGSPARLPQSVLQILRPQTLHGFDTWNSKDPPTGFPAGLRGIPKTFKNKSFCLETKGSDSRSGIDIRKWPKTNPPILMGRVETPRFPPGDPPGDTPGNPQGDPPGDPAGTPQRQPQVSPGVLPGVFPWGNSRGVPRGISPGIPPSYPLLTVPNWRVR
jgi:hypothetical protein